MKNKSIIFNIKLIVSLLLFGIFCLAYQGEFQILFDLLSVISLVSSTVLIVYLIVNFKMMKTVSDRDQILEIILTIPFGLIVAKKTEGFLQIITFSLIVMLLMAIYFYMIKPKHLK